MADPLCGWQVREKELMNRRAGLLMTVVKWGKEELFNRVVNDSNFADQRSPALVQQAFQLGLKLAGNTKQFDVKLIELLLQQNANPADVFISDLFRLVGPTNPDGVVDDAFGYLASLAHAFDSKGIAAAAWAKGIDVKRRLTGSPGSPSKGSSKAARAARAARAGGEDSGGEESPTRGGIRAKAADAGNRLRRISRGGSMRLVMMASKSRKRSLVDEDKATEAEKKSLAEAAERAAADEDKGNTPWQHGHKLLMNKLIPG